MGVVYRADDLKLGRPVALKFLRSDLTSDTQARARLTREARLASRLNHPNIATIYEVGETAEATFIAMELINGESLGQILLRGGFPTLEYPALAREIAEGLDAAHRMGVVHRDVKPGNIILDDRQRVKILDFGLAVVAHKERTPEESFRDFTTRTGTHLSTAGTVPYMAPEQLRGDATDPRSDIFSFGVLLYECLSGRRPFTGNNVIDVMHAILHQQSTALHELVPDTVPEWERFIARCMEKPPERRFQTMGEALAVLPTGPIRKTQREESVAVLYFENLGEATDDAHLRDGMTEDIITELSKIEQLRVYPRSAVVGYRDRQVTAPQIGEELNALYVLDGSLRHSHKRLRITAQLVETRTGHSVWAERYDRQLEDVFTIQDEIAQNIARALRVMLTDDEKQGIVKAPTIHVQAYEYYLRGKQFFYQWHRQGLQYAERMYRKAIEIDPSYARAYAGIADCYSVLHYFWDPRESVRRQADEASRKALELGPDLAESHSARGLVLILSKRYDDARKQFEAAIRLNPNLFEPVYFYGRTCLSQGNLTRAAQCFKRAADLRPEDYQSSNQLAACYVSLGRETDARHAYRRVVAATEKQLALHPETLYNVGCFYVLQGDTDKAVDCLERSVRHGFAHKDWIQHDPDLNPLRTQPRFHALVESL
jgi:non-specific serine/threonine protein kinase